MENNQMQFFMPMNPPTKTYQEKKLGVTKKGRAYIYEDEELKAVRQKLMAHLGQHAPDKPIEGAIQLIVKWCFPIIGKHLPGDWKTSKPDTDNLQKMLKDCMTACSFWKDDAQVASEIVQKFYCDVPGIFIAEVPPKVVIKADGANKLAS